MLIALLVATVKNRRAESADSPEIENDNEMHKNAIYTSIAPRASAPGPPDCQKPDCR